MKPKTKILIVDDEQINLEFFGVMLSKLGFDVEKASDGEEALEKVKRFRPSLVILDNIMPKRSGWEVTKIIKETEEFSDVRNTPIIMFSAMDDVKDKLEGFELGIEDYITKPFNFSEVLARIKAVLRHKDLADQLMQRERRIALREDRARLLEDFTGQLRALLEQADIQSCLAALDGLEKKLHESQKEEAALKENEMSLEELDARYRMNLEGTRGAWT
jgi:DNA-binding response OmpR family regulator